MRIKKRRSDIATSSLVIFRFFGCGGRDRTTDFQVMSLTSYHCSTPRYYQLISELRCKGTAFF